MVKAIQLGILSLFCISALAQTPLTGQFKYPDGTGINGYALLTLDKSSATGCSIPSQVQTSKPQRINIVNGSMGAISVFSTTCTTLAYNVAVYDSNRNQLYRGIWIVPVNTAAINIADVESFNGSPFWDQVTFSSWAGLTAPKWKSLDTQNSISWSIMSAAGWAILTEASWGVISQ
jgi:hypothetical protein